VKCNNNKKNKGLKFISVGRLIETKNHKLLISAFRKCVKFDSDVHLDIFGDGPLRSELEELVKSYELENNITLHGFVKNISEHYLKSDVFVLTSTSEGFGNVLTEAMSYGVPVVSTDCPSGPSEITDDGVFGILVDNKSELQLSNALIRVMKNDEERLYYANRSIERAKFYEKGKIAQIYFNEITKL